MSITLDAVTLPSGLVWEDEFAWTPVTQSLDYTLTGALVLEESTRQAGRPITLTGLNDGNDYTAWITRTTLLALREMLAVAGATFTLILHDGRHFTVAPRQENDGPLTVAPVPIYKTFSPADPDANHYYSLTALRLLEVVT